MNDHFQPARLHQIRLSSGMNMAETARFLNLSTMGYCRYEYGDRTPSHQMIEYLAVKLGTSYEYLCGISDDPAPTKAIVSQEQQPLLFSLVQELQGAPEDVLKRLLAYYSRLKT